MEKPFDLAMDPLMTMSFGYHQQLTGPVSKILVNNSRAKSGTFTQEIRPQGLAEVG